MVAIPRRDLGEAAKFCPVQATAIRRCARPQLLGAMRANFIHGALENGAQVEAGAESCQVS
jgi:hypothetical protein